MTNEALDELYKIPFYYFRPKPSIGVVPPHLWARPMYFHDTPSKSLFNEDNRAFSHGCIRLADPVKLATYLLRNQPEWTTEKMNVAMASSIEKWVPLKKPSPVFIAYFTAWVDSEGLLNFREDIYGHDKNLAKHLFN